MVIFAVFLGIILVLCIPGWTFRGRGDFFTRWPWALGLAGAYLLLRFVVLRYPELSWAYEKGHIVFLFGIGTLLLLEEKNMGSMIAGLGLLANGLVILVNGKMPVAATALEKAGQGELLHILERGESLSHTLLDTQTTKLFFLGDLFAIHLPVLGGIVISVGDILIALGCFLWIVGYGRGEKHV